MNVYKRYISRQKQETQAKITCAISEGAYARA